MKKTDDSLTSIIELGTDDEHASVVNSKRMVKRKFYDKLFYRLCQSTIILALIILVVLIAHILISGLSWLSIDFFTNFTSRFAEQAGIKAAIAGSMWVLFLTASFAIPLGVSAAIFLEEYAPKSKWVEWVQINIGNLAGMPSIVYGLVGLTVFVRYLNFERSLLAGSLTLALLVLPIIIISSQEAIKAVPLSLREAAYALGARKWQVVFLQVLPAALPGILTGVILSVSRAIGETAPLIVIGALSFVAFTPGSIWDEFTVLPIQIYNWASKPQVEFHQLAAAAIIVLLVLLFAMNFLAIYLRQKYQRYKL